MAELKIELIAIGDEILLGHTLDTNSNWIATSLSENSFSLRWLSIVGDNASDLKHQFRRAWNRADVVLLTGGLGPTHDDITRPVIARFFDDELVERPDLAAKIREQFTVRGLAIPPGTESMSLFPSRGLPIPNNHGAAPGIHYSLEDRELFALPGVPVEMRGMFSEYVLPILEIKRKEYFQTLLIRTAGIGELQLSELIGDEDELAPLKLAYLPSIDQGVTLRLSLATSDPEDAVSILKRGEDHIRGCVGDYIYGTGQITLEKVILDLLQERGMKLALAESCTGGLVASRIVSIPGSSNSFERGLVTYSNRAKIELLGVDEEILERHGAVSSATARAMAEGALTRSDVDIAAAVTGIAGPTGGTPEKPVGLVYTAVADRKGCNVKRFLFTGDRNSNRRRSAQAVMVMLWQRLKQ